MNFILRFLFIFALAFTSLASHATPAPQKVLRIGMAQEWETHHPIIQQMSAALYINGFTNHPLTVLNEDWKWVCTYCTEIPTFENGKAKFIFENGKKKILTTWEIKPEAKWGDGTEVTGHDIRLGWEIGKNPHVPVGLKETYTDIEDVTVDEKNPRQFTIKFSKAKYDYAELGTFYAIPTHLEKKIWEDSRSNPSLYEKNSLYQTEPTNPGLYLGSFILQETTPASHAVLKRNPYFYGEAAKLDVISVRVIPDTAALEANLLSGSIDMIGELGLSFEQARAFAKRLKNDADLAQKFDVQFKDGPIYEHIDLNLRNPILQDIRVRQALLMGINRDEITEGLFDGKQPKAVHYVHPKDPCFTADVTTYPFDLKKAAELLDAAGWKIGSDGLREKDGVLLSLSFMTTADDSTREVVQTVIQRDLKKIGVQIVIKNEPARVFVGETVAKGKYSALAMYKWTFNPGNPRRSMLHSSQIPSAENGFSGENSGAWINTTVDKNLDALDENFNLSARCTLIHGILKEYTRELPVLPLYFRSEIAVTPKKLKGFSVTGLRFYSSLWAQQWDF